MRSQTREFIADPYGFCRRNGREPFVAKVFDVPTLFISDSERAREALLTSDDQLSGKAGNRSVANALFGTSVLYEDGDWHRRLRNAMASMFKTASRGSAEVVQRETIRFADWARSRRLLRSHDFFRSLSLAITSACFLGYETHCLDSVRLSKKIDALGKGLYATTLSNKRRSRFQIARSARHELDQYLGGRLAATFRQPLEEAGLDEQAILDQAVTLLFAGVDTTSATLAWATAFLAEHIASGQMVTRSIAAGMVRRSLVLHPPVYFIPRGVVVDTTLGGITVKKGWNVNIMVSALHEDMDSRGKSDGYMPFGLGDKRCPGEAFAIGASTTVLETLFSRFKISLEGGDHSKFGFMPGQRPAASDHIHIASLQTVQGDLNHA